MRDGQRPGHGQAGRGDVGLVLRERGPDSRGAGVREIIRPVYVIYHDQCPDGFGAAWAAFQALGYTTGNGSPVHYVPSRYGQRPPEMDPEGVVYILDFSYNLETMTEALAPPRWQGHPAGPPQERHGGTPRPAAGLLLRHGPVGRGHRLGLLQTLRADAGAIGLRSGPGPVALGVARLPRRERGH